MALPLSESTKVEIRAMWAKRLRVPLSYFERAGQKYVERNDSAWVVIVELDDSQIIVAPSLVSALLSQIPTDQLFDLGIITAKLAQFSPQPIGTALLLYTEMKIDSPFANESRRIATAESVEEFLTECLTSEVDESGLRGMEVRFEEVDSRGVPIAIAGYEIWNENVAQLGVLVKARQRGKGYGRMVANIAISDARSKGLIPQWRVRVDNVPSVNLAAQLGFVRLGRQVALDVVTPKFHSFEPKMS